MSILSSSRRDPVAFGLAVLAALLGLVAVFELAHGHWHGWRHLLEAREEKLPSLPAGIDDADFSPLALELFGWAPPDTGIRILDRNNKEVASDVADDGGKWDLSFAPENRRNLQIFSAGYQEEGKPSADIGKLVIYAPGKPDDASIWWQESGSRMPHILQISGTEESLTLALAQSRDSKTQTYAGRAAPNAIVQIYADNQLAGTAVADDKGFWTAASLIGADKRNVSLRIDEIRKSIVAARLGYRLAWPEGKDVEPGLPQAAEIGLVVALPEESGKTLVYIIKSDTGTEMPPEEEIPGQVIPLTSEVNQRP